MKQVYVAMPLLLMEKDHLQIVRNIKKTFIKNYPKYMDHKFFNPFVEVEQENLPSNEIMDICFKVVKESSAVLCILPKPLKIYKTVTLGAISESSTALKEGKPVYICLYNKKKHEIFEIKSLDDLFNKIKLKVPLHWFGRMPDLELSDKYIEKDAKI